MPLRNTIPPQSDPRIYVRDYTHAANVFRPNSYENAPRLKFLYHVYFTINVVEIPILAKLYSGNDSSIIGLLVRNIQLPSYEVETETLNQYNRKRIIQKKINYRPVNVEFHDDGGDKTRQLWYNYFSYYYKDPTQSYDNVSVGNGQQPTPGFSYNSRDIYVGDRAVNDWGFTGEGYSGTGDKPAFFKDIKIYGFDQQNFAEYVLINPIIKSWEHDSYDYSEDNGTMKNRMTIEYETVKYYSGKIGPNRPDDNAVGFADPAHYDQNSGSLKYK